MATTIKLNEWIGLDESFQMALFLPPCDQGRVRYGPKTIKKTGIYDLNRLLQWAICLLASLPRKQTLGLQRPLSEKVRTDLNYNHVEHC